MGYKRQLIKYQITDKAKVFNQNTEYRLDTKRLTRIKCWNALGEDKTIWHRRKETWGVKYTRER